MYIPEDERLLFRQEPTSEAIQAAHESITKHETSINTIERQIQILQAQTQALRYEQAKHRAAIERSWGVITLARRLPEELLIKIFAHCVEDGWTRAPMVVSHVCSTWRKAALAPVVWSHVYARCDDTNVHERTKFWLKMAGRTGLHVTIQASWRAPQWQLTKIMKLLAEHASQWQSFTIITDLHVQTNLILRSCSRPMPQLRMICIQTLTMDMTPPDGDVTIQPLDDIFAYDRAPRLRHVNLICGLPPDVPVLPSHITSLSLDVQNTRSDRPLSMGWIIDALEPLQDLRALTLSMPLVYDHPFILEVDSPRLVSLPYLITLTLYGPTDLNSVLSHFHTPALRHLHLRSLEDVGYRQQPIAPSLTHFLAESSPPLELLELHDIDLSPEAFAECFASLPHLRELRLHESSISDATVALLRGPRGLCPRLARIDFRWCSMLRGRALVDLVRSRCAVDNLPSRSLYQMEEVGLVNCCFVMEEDVLDLARLSVCRVVMREGEDYCRKCYYFSASFTIC